MVKDFQPVMGLEIHAQLLTESKLFSTDPAGFSEKENTHIHPVSLALPGTLPVLNFKVVEFAVQAGLAMHCQIQKESVFARKNYFYPDLPKGYQISQYNKPLCRAGYVEFDLKGKRHRVRIQRIHIEEDAGRFHHKGGFSLVNFNRAGVPLVEIVSEPDIHHPEEAAELARTIRRILRYLKICDGNLEEGSLRCDCNVSVKKKGADKLGQRVELKNLNSFKFIEKALEYEIKRQIQVLSQGGKVLQETRLYDSAKNKTFPLRSKEDASDYRYFSEPDLPPLKLTEEWITRQKQNLPELPLVKATRLRDQYGLASEEAGLLTEEGEKAAYFEKTAHLSQRDLNTLSSSLKKEGEEVKKEFSKLAANWFINEVLARLSGDKKNVSEYPVPPGDLSQLLQKIYKGDISGKIAKMVFEQMWQSGGKVDETLKKLNLKQITDTEVLNRMVEQVLLKFPGQVEAYQKGKKKLFGFFVGQVMKLSRGQAAPEALNQILKNRLKS